jgi:hypothetical protein
VLGNAELCCGILPQCGVLPRRCWSPYLAVVVRLGGNEAIPAKEGVGKAFRNRDSRMGVLSPPAVVSAGRFESLKLLGLRETETNANANNRLAAGVMGKGPKPFCKGHFEPLIDKRSAASLLTVLPATRVRPLEPLARDTHTRCVRIPVSDQRSAIQMLASFLFGGGREAVFGQRPPI